MTSEQQLTPAVKAWLKGTADTPYGAEQGVRQVMAQVPQTRQRGRWLPFRLFHRKAQTPTATDTAEYQPGPIPATNGHTPTVIGRTQSMFSPVKAITAGALVFAIGGVLLVAQPFDQQGASVPGAATDGAVSLVRGQFTATYWTGGGYLPLDGMMERLRDADQNGRLEMDDERLSGSATLIMNVDRWANSEVPEGDSALFWGTVLIENEGGTWEGTHLSADGQARDRYNVSSVMQLVGSGDYEGLSAILYFTIDPGSTRTLENMVDSVDGIIFPGDLPPNR